MKAVPFDTLQLARGLAAAGLRTELVSKMDAWGADLIGKIAALGADTSAKFAALSMDMHARFMAANAKAAAKMELLRRDTTIKLGGLVHVGVGVLLAAFRFMPHQ